MRKKGKTVNVSRELLHNSKIPQKFYELEVETYPGGKAALESIRAFGKNIDVRLNNGESIFLHGPPNSCKTYLACAVGIKAISESRYVFYRTYDDLVDQMMNEAWEFQNTIQEPDLLILDYVDKPMSSKEGFTRALLRTLRFRRDNKKSTLLVSCLEYEDFIAAYSLPAHLMQEKYFDFCTEHLSAEALQSIRAKLAKSMEGSNVVGSRL